MYGPLQCRSIGQRSRAEKKDGCNLDGCDPDKISTTIPNEEEIAVKHSCLDSQLKTSATLSLPLSPLLSLSLSLSLWTYRSMRKGNETVDFIQIDSQLADIE